MADDDIKKQVGDLANAWEQFKQKNDEELKEIKKKGSADPLITEQLGKMNTFMDETKKTIDLLQTAAVRPGAGANADEAKTKELEKEHKDALLSYLRKGNTSAIEALQTKTLSMSVGSDPDGGYLVTPQMSATINKIVFETSPMRQLASIETISSDALDMIDDPNEPDANWTGETTAAADTNTPQIGKRQIFVYEVSAQPKVTQKLLDDASINVEAWLAAKVADKFSRKENTAFITGSGVNQPRGFTTYASGTTWGTIEQVASGVSSTFTADDLITLFYKLKAPYMANASWLMNRATVATVRKFKSNEDYIWQPGLTAGSPDILLGRPLLMATDMAVAASNSLSIAVGDFKTGYQIVDRMGITILRDPYTAAPNVRFFTRKRTGGDVINFEAIKLLKLG